MSTNENVKHIIADYGKKADEATSDLQRKLIAVMQQRDTLGEVYQLGKIAKRYKRTNKSNNDTLALLSGVSANTISSMTNNPTNSKVSTVLALLDAMGMTLTISRKNPNE